MDLDIEENVALTTASSSGLGFASAQALVRDGANVVINGRDGDSLAEAKADLEAEAAGDASVVAVEGDIMDPDDLDRLVETTLDEFGRLDHLVTSAGRRPGPSSTPTTRTGGRPRSCS